MKVQKEMVTGPWGMIWKTVAGVSVVLLMAMAFHQAAKSQSGRKSLHGGMALPYQDFDTGDLGDRWTTERLCRHFKAGGRGARSAPGPGGGLAVPLALVSSCRQPTI